MTAVDARYMATVYRIEGCNRTPERREIEGDGPFMVQMLDVLLADPAMQSFEIHRTVEVPQEPPRQVGDALPASLQVWSGAGASL